MTSPVTIEYLDRVNIGELETLRVPAGDPGSQGFEVELHVESLKKQKSNEPSLLRKR